VFTPSQAVAHKINIEKGGNKMLRSKKMMTVLLASSIVMATGCSSSSNPSTNGTSNESANGRGTAGAQGQKVKLEFLSNKSDVVDTVSKIIAKFQEKNPNIEITQNAPPNMLKVLSMRFSTNDAPPIFTVYPSAPSMTQPVKDGYIEDITGDPVLNNVDANAIEFGKNDGKNYAVPLAMEGYGVIYNVDMFKQLNLTPPKTYDELLQDAAKIKAAGKTPFLVPAKDFTYLRRFGAALLALDNPDINPFFKDVLTGKKHITDTNDMQNVAQKILDLSTKFGQNDLLGMSEDNAVREFINGNTAMMFSGMWNVNAIKKANPDQNVDMFLFPAVKAEDTKAPMQIGTALAIPKNSKTAKEAKQFIDFFATTEMSQLYADETQNISIVKGVKNKSKGNQVLIDAVAGNKIVRAADSPWKPSMQDDFGKGLQELLAGGTVDAFVKKMDGVFYGKGN
jgi:raffinose/stachyose/melibiose transport system substrate-binding protein